MKRNLLSKILLGIALFSFCLVLSPGLEGKGAESRDNAGEKKIERMRKMQAMMERQLQPRGGKNVQANEGDRDVDHAFRTVNGKAVKASRGMTRKIPVTPDANGTISGRVTNTSESGIPYIVVEVYDLLGNYLFEYEGYTDQYGYYSLLLPPGSYKLYFYDEDKNYAWEWYNDKITFNSADPVTVTSGGYAENINIQLVAPGSISGRVSDPSNSGIEDIRVSVYDMDHDWVANAYTGAAGDYTVTGLPQGSFKVFFKVLTDYDVNFVSEWYNDKASFAAADPVAISIGSVTPSINAQLAVGGQIQGMVKDASGNPLAFGIQVDVLNVDSQDTISLYTTDIGSYHAMGLATGNYKVKFSSASENFNYLTEWYNNKSSSDAADLVAVAAGNSILGIDAQLAPGGQITGRVTDTGGTGIDSVVIYVYDLSSNLVNQISQTDSGGYYTVSGLSTGSYKLFFKSPETMHVSEWYNDKNSFETADPVTVTESNVTANINVQLALGGDIISNIYDANGDPIISLEGNIEVRAYDSGDNLIGIGYNERNSYQFFSLPVGDYKIEFHDLTGKYVGEWYNDKADSAAADLVSVTAGNYTTGIDAYLAIVPETIAVTAPNGGENWTVGSSRDITWTSTGGIASVKIEYSTDNGGSWIPVAASTANDGIHSWTIPDAPSATCLIKISDIDGSPLDASDAVFTISSPIVDSVAVTSPNGGESWTASSSHNITWSSTGTIANVKIEYSTNGGGSWTTEAASTANDGAYPWTVPVSPSTACLVRVSDIDGDPADSSNAAFTIVVPASSISGTVTDGTSPIADVDVYLYDLSYSYVDSTYTDGSGSYLFSGLEAGSYKIRFSPYGLNYFGEWYNDKESFSSADAIAVTSGGSTTGINAVLAPGGQIRGRVTNASAAGIPGIDVWAWDASENPLEITTTDSQGEYALNALPTGSYRIEYRNDGQNYISEWYNDKADFATADAVSVTAGSTVSGIDAQLAGGGVITGRVTDMASAGIAYISVIAYDSDGSVAYSDNTDANGDYSLAGLPTGSYKVFFDVQNGNHLDEWYSDKASFATADAVAVTVGGTTSGINAQLATGGSISGRVSDSVGTGIEYIDVTVYDMNQNVITSYGTGPDGVYSLDGLPTGNYRVRFHPYHTANFAEEWYNDKDSFAQADDIAVTAGSETSGIDAVLAPGAQIGGTVTDSLGSPIANVEVIAYSTSSGEYYDDETDGSGNYVIQQLPGGGYKLYFNSRQAGNYVSTWYSNKSCFNSADALTLAVGESLAGVDVQLATGGQVTGRITNGSGTGLEGIFVVAFRESDAFDSDWEHQPIGQSDAAGNYTVSGLPTGNVRLWFFPYESSYAFEWYGDTILPEEAQPVSVTAGSVTPGIDAQLVPGGSVSPTVSMPGGGNASDVPHFVFDSQDRLVLVGYWDFDSGESITLPAGDYKFLFQWWRNVLPQWYNHQAHGGLADLVTVTAGQNTPMQPVQLEQGGGTLAVSVDTAAGQMAKNFSLQVFDLENHRVAYLPAYMMEIGDEFDGTCRINLPAGSYKLFIQPSCAYGSEWYPDKGTFAAALPVAVSDGLQTAITVVLGGADPVDPAITVTAPNGGEVWNIGESYEITWNSFGDIAAVDILYSTDNGDNWTLEAENEANDGSYTWVVDALPSLNCLVRVMDSDGSPSDTSDAVFTVTNPGVDTVTIAGTVLCAGAPLAGVTLNGLPSSPLTDVSGAYSDEVDRFWSGTVTPSLAQYVFTPRSYSYNLLETDQLAQDFTAYHDSSEPNDESASASGLAMGTNAGLIFAENDVEWYRFYVPAEAAGQDLRVNVRVTSTYPVPAPDRWSSDIDFELLDGSLRVLGIAYSASDNETLYLKGVASGWYYIYIDYCTTEYADSSGFARYAIELETGDGFVIGQVSGRVVDGAGQGIENVLVSLKADSGYVSQPCMTSGPGGYFTVAFAPGTYHLFFSGKNSNSANHVPVNVVSEYYDNQKILSDADPVTFADGQDLQLGDVVLDIGAIVSGRVTQISGTPMLNATVQSYDPEGNKYEVVWTDAAGNYTLQRVPVGGAKLRFSSGSWAVEYYNDKPTLGSADILATEPGVAISGIDAQLGVGGTITGTVSDGLGAGIGGVKVTLYSVLDGTTYRSVATTAAESGSFTIASILPGDYKLFFDTTGLSFFPEWYADADSFATATVVSVSEGNTTAGINAQLNANVHVISGTVTWEAAPLAGVVISGLPGDPAPETDASGHYSATVEHGWSGTVTPQLSNFSFTPPSTAYANVTADQETNYAASIGQPLLVTAPAAGAMWERGKTYAIRWLKQGAQNANVKIQLYKGTTLVKTITSTTANDGEYSWLVPTTLATGTTYFIKVKTVDNLVYDDSDPFAIIVPGMTITAPTTGTIWVKNAIKTIAWTKKGTLDANVKILLYKGLTKKLDISLSAPNSGSYDWLVPNTLANGSDYTVKVITLDGKVTAKSGKFTIAAGVIRVTSPATGAKLIRGEEQEIAWTSEGAVNANVRIELYKGTTKVLTIAASVPTADGAFTWTVPAAQALATTYTVKITALDNLISGKTGSFSIVAGIITVTAPAAGAVWQRGQPHIITWTKEGTLNANVKIQLYKGTTLVSTLASTTPNDESHEWTIPAAQKLASTYKIRVATVDGLVKADSGVFTISADAGLALTAPNGGEALKAGEPYEIRWSDDPGVLEVKLEFSRDNGGTYTKIADHVEDTGRYEWVVPVQFTKNGIVRVSDASGRAWQEEGVLEYAFRFLYDGAGSDAGLKLWFGSHDVNAPSYGFGRIEIGNGSIGFGGLTRAVEPLAGSWHELKVRLDLRRDEAGIWLDEEALFENAALGTTRERHFEPGLALAAGGEQGLEMELDDLAVRVVRQDELGEDRQAFMVLRDDFERYDAKANPIASCWQLPAVTDEGSTVELNAMDPRNKTLRLRTEAGKQFHLRLPFALPERVPFDISDERFSITNE